MTGAVTTRANADRVASMVAGGLSQLADAEYWKFPGDDLLIVNWGRGRPGG